MIHEQVVLRDLDREAEAHHARVLREARAREFDQLLSMVVLPESGSSAA